MPGERIFRPLRMRQFGEPPTGRPTDTRASPQRHAPAQAATSDKRASANYALLRASERGDVDKVRALVANGTADVNAVDAMGEATSLHYAAAEGHAQIVALLLRAKADPDAVDDFDRTPLYWAAQMGHVPIAELLLDAYADIDAADKDGQTPLHVACRWQKSDVTQLLLASGASLHDRHKDGRAPVHECILRSEYPLISDATLKTLRALVEYGAEWDATCDSMVTQGLACKEAAALSVCMQLWLRQRVEGAPLTPVPFEIVLRGVNATKAFLEDLQRVVVLHNVCVVGPSCSGKTSLFKSISQWRPHLEHADDRALGVDYHRFRFERVDATTRTAELHDVTVWDVSGQKAHDAMRSILHTPRMTYLVLVDLEGFVVEHTQVLSTAPHHDETKSLDDFVEMEVMPWIRDVIARRADAEVVFVMSKIDVLDSGARAPSGGSKGAEALVQNLANKLRLIGSPLGDKILVRTSCTSFGSVHMATAAMEHVLVHSKHAHRLSDIESKVLDIVVRRLASEDQARRGETIVIDAEELCDTLEATVSTLTKDASRVILRTFHNVGRIILFDAHGRPNEDQLALKLTQKELEPSAISDQPLGVQVTKEAVDEEEQEVTIPAGENASPEVPLARKESPVGNTDGKATGIVVTPNATPTQSLGFSGVYRSPHFSQFCSDGSNEYIAMDLDVNENLLMYVKRRLIEYKRFAVERLVKIVSLLPDIERVVNAFVAEAMKTEALYIFHGVMQDLAYMHSLNVCHLGIDPIAIVMDATLNPRLIDFGSSEVMTDDGLTGTDDRLIKFKPLYVAKEVRANNQHAPPRPGFLGAAADMWSSGVLLYQLLCFGYPKGHLALICDQNWHHNLMCHAQEGYGTCLGIEACLICFRAISFPPEIYEIFVNLLIVERPADRMLAAIVTTKIAPLLERYELDFETRAKSILDAVMAKEFLESALEETLEPSDKGDQPLGVQVMKEAADANAHDVELEATGASISTTKDLEDKSSVSLDDLTLDLPSFAQLNPYANPSKGSDRHERRWQPVPGLHDSKESIHFCRGVGQILKQVHEEISPAELEVRANTPEFKIYEDDWVAHNDDNQFALITPLKTIARTPASLIIMDDLAVRNTQENEVSGYLRMRGERNRSYKRRYMELNGNILAYYKTKPEKDGFPLSGEDKKSCERGAIHLDRVTSIQPMDPESEPFGINLVTTSSMCSIAAESDEDYQRWLESLCSGVKFSAVHINFRRMLQLKEVSNTAVTDVRMVIASGDTVGETVEHIFNCYKMGLDAAPLRPYDPTKYVLKVTGYRDFMLDRSRVMNEYMHVRDCLLSKKTLRLAVVHESVIQETAMRSLSVPSDMPYRSALDSADTLSMTSVGDDFERSSGSAHNAVLSGDVRQPYAIKIRRVVNIPPHTCALKQTSDEAALTYQPLLSSSVIVRIELFNGGELLERARFETPGVRLKVQRGQNNLLYAEWTDPIWHQFSMDVCDIVQTMLIQLSVVGVNRGTGSKTVDGKEETVLVTGINAFEVDGVLTQGTRYVAMLNNLNDCSVGPVPHVVAPGEPIIHVEFPRFGTSIKFDWSEVDDGNRIALRTIVGGAVAQSVQKSG